MRFLKSRRLAYVLVVVLLLANSSASALALSAKQRAVIRSGNSYFNVEEHGVCSSSPTQSGSYIAPGSRVYVLGDSLTVGMRDSGDLQAKIEAENWSVSKINAVGGEILDWGAEQVALDEESIRTSNVAIVGLGTNNVGDVVDGDTVIETGKDNVKTQIVAIASAIKTINPEIKLFWTSVYIEGSLTTKFGTFNLDVARPELNQAIDEAKVEGDFGIIPWGSSIEAPELISSDGIHPSGKYPEMAEYVVAHLRSDTPETSASNCQCTVNQLPGNTNIERVFNYFTGKKGLSAEIAAGIIGNMVKESPGVAEGNGPIEPQQLQNEFDVKIPSSEAVSKAVTGSSLGWGIVQWTPGVKIITTARDAGVAFDEIDTLEFQLDFLWGQLTGEGWRGNPDNQSNEKSAGDIIFASTTVEEATINFGQKYERFGGSSDLTNPEYAKRIDSALDVYNSVKPSGASTISCGATQAGANGWDLPLEGPNPMVYYQQRSSGDDPSVQGYYGNESYGPGPIAHCGCGPTSWAMIVSTLTGTIVTPTEVAMWASAGGFQKPAGEEPCGGSEWWWAQEPGLSASKWGVVAQSIELTQVASSLRAGKLVLMSSGPGPFTSNGHILVIRAVTDDGKYLFADPNDYNDDREEAAVFNGESKSRTPLAEADFSGSINSLWEVSPR